MRNRKMLISGAVVVLMGIVPAASAATTPSAAQSAAPTGAALDLALPAAAITSVTLDVQKKGDLWTLTVKWNINYSAANIADQTTYRTYSAIYEQDDVDDDLVAGGGRQIVSLKPRTQGHSLSQAFTLNDEALHTEIGDEEIYARASAQNMKTGNWIELNTRRVIFDV